VTNLITPRALFSPITKLLSVFLSLSLMKLGRNRITHSRAIQSRNTLPHGAQPLLPSVEPR